MRISWSVRDAIFWMHLSAGVVTGIFILIMSVTGTLLAFEPQIIAFADSHVSSVSAPEGVVSPLSLETLLVKAKALKPDENPESLAVRAKPNSSVAVGFGRNDTFYLNPYTGENLGAGSNIQKIMNKIEVLHRWFGMEGKLKPIGHQIKGVSTIIFFIIISSGFYLWWPRRWNFRGIKNIIVFNRLAKGKARDWNWHNVIGFWCAPFLMVIALTGIIMAYGWANNFLYCLTGNQAPVKQAEKMAEEKKTKEAEKVNVVTAIDLDGVFNLAKQKVPNWESITIRLPQKAHGKANVTIENDSFFKPVRRSQLTLNMATGEVVSFEPFKDQNPGRKLRLWVRFLHTGEALGFWGQLVAFVASAGATLLVWTGLALAWRRFYSWRQKRIQV